MKDIQRIRDEIKKDYQLVRQRSLGAEFQNQLKELATRYKNKPPDFSKIDMIKALEKDEFPCIESIDSVSRNRRHVRLNSLSKHVEFMSSRGPLHEITEE